MKLALGTVQFGFAYGIGNHIGQVSRAEAKAMLQFALTSGIDTLDTAVAYGESEECLGEVGTQGFKIISKLPALPDSCFDVSAWVQQEVRASLSRLGVTSVYGLLLHRSENLLGPSGAALYRALQTVKENGQAQKVGVSIYSPTELDVLIPPYQFDLVQAPFNLVDQRLHRTGWMQRLKDADVEIHTRSVFLQGLLLMKQSNVPTKFSPWNDIWRTWFQWLAEHNESAVQACLAVPLSFPEIDRVLVGADNAKQLAQIVIASRVQPTSALPNLQCEHEKLINPAKWHLL